MKTKSVKASRQSLRLKDYDYTQPGVYFVTIVTHRRICLFGNIIENEMQLNTTGRIAQSLWKQLPQHFSTIDLDVFVVMPNHIHVILHITDKSSACVGAQHAAPGRLNVQPGSLGAIVRSFKSAVTKRYNEQHAGSRSEIWQRNYYEHIIRDESALLRIREYIATNPARWPNDPENPNALKPETYDAWRSTERAQHTAPLPETR